MREGTYGKFNKLKNKPIFKKDDIEIRSSSIPDLIYWQISDLSTSKFGNFEIYEIVMSNCLFDKDKPWRIIALQNENNRTAFFQDFVTLDECLECIEKECNMFTPYNLKEIIEADLTCKIMTGQFEA